RFAHAPGGRAVEPQRLRRPLHEVEVAHHVVIENRDVPARHVGDDGRVLVLPQLAHDPAHRDDVVVGMRRKDQHPPARRQLCSPVAIRAISLAPRMVATPIVIASRGTLSSPKKSAAASFRVTVSSVTRRVRESGGEPGSLKPMWPLLPMPRIWKSMPPASPIA